MSVADARSRLRALGERRVELRAAEQQLSADTRRELVESVGLVAVPEAADLAGIGRSTAYEWLADGRGDDDDEHTRAAVGAA